MFLSSAQLLLTFSLLLQLLRLIFKQFAFRSQVNPLPIQDASIIQQSFTSILIEHSPSYSFIINSLLSLVFILWSYHVLFALFLTNLFIQIILCLFFRAKPNSIQLLHHQLISAIDLHLPLNIIFTIFIKFFLLTEFVGTKNFEASLDSYTQCNILIILNPINIIKKKLACEKCIEFLVTAINHNEKYIKTDNYIILWF